ncbi:MAG: hypothetical protein JWN61_2217 [Pseudonocardiales bacterium]|nr:hypothetical protein [Pseudonocardiales bacterium]
MRTLDLRMAIRLALATVVLPAAAWAIGINWVYCLLIAAAAAAGVAALELPALGREPNWPVPDEARHDGGRREIAYLSWMLTSRHGGTDRAAVLRLRETARRRLALRGIDLEATADMQRARDVLGPHIHSILLSDQGFSPSHRQIVQCIEALERLVPDPPPTLRSLGQE